MKIEFDLIKSGVIKDPKNIVDIDGNKLSYKTLCSILSLITYKYIYNHDTNHPEVPSISSKYFKSINEDYKLYLKYLRRNEVILWTKYEPGKYSRGYYFTDLFKEYSVVKNISLDSNDEVQIEKQLVSTYKKVDDRLYKDFNMINIIPDIKIDRYKNGKVDFKSYLSTLLNYKRICDNNTYYNYKTYRLYTPFTNCSKEVRLNNFNFGKDKLINIDIPSSFPLFLSLWCVNNGIDINDYDFIEFCSLIKEKRDKKGRSIIYNEIRKLLNKLKDSDIKDYNEETNEKPYYSYNKSKIEFQKFLNGDKSRNNITNNLFKFYFNSIYMLIINKNIKMYDEVVKMESNFIFNILINRLYKEVSGIKILTCHDEIYFEERFYDKVNIIWNEEINKLYDILPGNIDDIIDIDIEEENIDNKYKNIKKINNRLLESDELFDDEIDWTIDYNDPNLEVFNIK